MKLKTRNSFVGLCIAQAHTDNARHSLRLMLGALCESNETGLAISTQCLRERLEKLTRRLEIRIERAKGEVK